MDPSTLMIATLAGMTLAILIGIEVGLALGMAGLIGTYFLFNDLDKAVGALGSAAYSVLRDELFATIPLFVLMGDFVARSGAARDLYRLVNRGLKRIPGRLAVATVIGNAVFAAVTGVSIAAAAAFSRIAYPQMREHNYRRTFAIGSVAGMMIAPVVFLEPNMMLGILLYGFAGAVVGGLTSPGGAVIGGFMVGVAENLFGTYLIGSELKLTMALVLIVGVLLVRPAGMFGRVVVARV